MSASSTSCEFITLCPPDALSIGTASAFQNLGRNIVWALSARERFQPSSASVTAPTSSDVSPGEEIITLSTCASNPMTHSSPHLIHRARSLSQVLAPRSTLRRYTRTMTTHESIERWQHVFRQVTTAFDQTYTLMEQVATFPSGQAVGVMINATVPPLLDAWETSKPPEGSQLYLWIKPAVDAARQLDPDVLEVRPLKRYVGLVKKARDLMNVSLINAETADEIVDEMERALKVLVLAARLGHQGIMNSILDQWEDRLHTSDNSPQYLDLLTLIRTDEPSTCTIDYPTLRAAAHPGTASINEYMTDMNQETKTQMQHRFAGMWVVTFYAEWELNYRKRLAAIHNCSERAITSTLMRDLGYMRNDFAHNRGIATSKHKRCKRLPWFQQGQPMQPTQENYRQLFDEFAAERAAFTQAPKPIRSNQVELKSRLPQDLIDGFNAAAKERGLTSDTALEMAVSAWLCAEE